MSTDPMIGGIPASQWPIAELFSLEHKLFRHLTTDERMALIQRGVDEGYFDLDDLWNFREFYKLISIAALPPKTISTIKAVPEVIEWAMNYCIFNDSCNDTLGNLYKSFCSHYPTTLCTIKTFRNSLEQIGNCYIGNNGHVRTIHGLRIK